MRQNMMFDFGDEEEKPEVKKKESGDINNREFKIRSEFAEVDISVKGCSPAIGNGFVGKYPILFKAQGSKWEMYIYSDESMEYVEKEGYGEGGNSYSASRIKECIMECVSEFISLNLELHLENLQRELSWVK